MKIENSKIELIDIVKCWLKEEMPEWKVVRLSDQSFWIEYSKLSNYPCAELSETSVKFFDDDFEIHACDKNFLPLLSNRLHSAEQGFKKALAARTKYFAELRGGTNG